MKNYIHKTGVTPAVLKNREVRRRPTAADCNSPMARARPAAVGEQHAEYSDNHPFEMPILTHARWHDELSFIKQVLRLRLVRVARAAASRSGGPLFASAHSRGPPQAATRTTSPKINIILRTAPHGLQTGKPTKNARILLDVAIICTTFGPSDPSKRRESRCYHRKSGILQSDGNKRMSPSGRYHVPIGWSTSKRTAP